MRIAILSDLHGNLEAVKSVLNRIKISDVVDSYIFLGDIIDYGPHSNEVVATLKLIEKQVLCSIWGNHEHAILLEDYAHFSSSRGVDCARHTLETLSSETKKYLNDEMTSAGCREFLIGKKKCLAVHGSLDDCFWNSIKPDVDVSKYSDYDYVFSGHSHEPHFFEKYTKVDCPEMRNRKKTIFINPGSVGQPRNLNSCSQYAILDTETEEVTLRKVVYNVEAEMRGFTDEVDVFYKERIGKGV